MLTPGFVTDGFGLLLLFPPTRAMIRPILIRRFRHRVTHHQGPGPGSGTIHNTDIADIE